MVGIKDPTLADLSDAVALLHMHYQDAIHATQLQDLYEQSRLSKILYVKLEQHKSELERQFEVQVSERKRMELDRNRLEISLKDAMQENEKLQGDLSLSETRYVALQQTNERVEKELVDARKESVMANKEVIESQKKANETTQEIVKLKMELQTLNDKVNTLNDSSSARERATEEKAIRAERKSRDLEERLTSSEDNRKKTEKENSALKSRNKEIEARCKELEKKLLVLEKEFQRERNAASKTEKTELKNLEKQHRDEIAALTAQVTRQTILTEQAEKEVAMAKDQFQDTLTALEAKLETAQLKLKNTTRKTGKTARVEAPATSLLFTPEPERSRQQTRSRAKAAPGKLLEKSSFSMTPFLNRQSGAMPLSPMDVNRQVATSIEPEKPFASASEASTEHTSKSDSDYVEPAEKPKSSTSAIGKPVESRRNTTVAASLAALVSEELDSSTLEAQRKKKKRKLGPSRGPTIFDGPNEGILEAEPNKSRLEVTGRSNMAAAVAQRTFVGAKTISPLKKRNEKLRDMFKLP
ncbi:hypothetical protein V1525DRAFT_399856 [Lipomyces kononenkoae]|uniref:Uncharacterized protein n=1 Tax=Lipomyces kononenkoae TaxID=34357 RepID=A0ACC3T576_LIPKO